MRVLARLPQLFAFFLASITELIGSAGNRATECTRRTLARCLPGNKVRVLQASPRGGGGGAAVAVGGGDGGGGFTVTQVVPARFGGVQARGSASGDNNNNNDDSKGVPVADDLELRSVASSASQV